MRAVFCGCGLDITLTLKDKEEADETGKLECRLPEWRKPKLILHIVEEMPKKGFLEEPGFHIEAVPPHVGPEYRDRYDIYLSKERFRELTNPSGNPVIDGGYFVSRSIYDRVDIKYWGL